MPAPHYDLVVIGSGPAGQKGAIAAAKLRKRVAVIDRRDMVGGCSLHLGTIPSKTMREAILYLTGIRQRTFYGADYRAKENISAHDLAQRVDVVLQREIERRNPAMRLRNGARAIFSERIDPAAPQPVGRVEARRVLPLDPLCALDAEPPQHRVDQALVRQEPANMREIDACRHRGMRRRAQKQELRDADPQHVVDDRGARRQRGVKAVGDQRVDLAEPAQHRRHQQPRKGAVADRQGRHRGVVFDRVVEGAFPPQHRADQVERDLTGGRGGGGQGSAVRFCARHRWDQSH